MSDVDVEYSTYIGNMLAHVEPLEAELGQGGKAYKTELCLARLTCYMLSRDMLKKLFYDNVFGFHQSRRVIELEKLWSEAAQCTIYHVRSVVSGAWLHGEKRKAMSERFLSLDLPGDGYLRSADSEAQYWLMVEAGLGLVFPALHALAEGVPFEDVFPNG